MKIHYYPETDSLYLAFREGPGAEADEIADGVVVDFDAAGRVVGLEVQSASSNLDLNTLEVKGIALTQILATTDEAKAQLSSTEAQPPRRARAS